MRLSDDARLCPHGHENRPFLKQLFATFMQPFRTLHRIAWSAPWSTQER
ncbi:hypothetical protein [Sphingobium estronivorans]|nr:hypothetical protein [Sphingobium estronivorans]